ncbi:MAG: VPLPA-CTERM sorting domain-containing protein [Gammaproteobacteria bacterium]
MNIKLIQINVAFVAMSFASSVLADVVTFDNFDDSHNATVVDLRELWDIGATAPAGDKVLTIGVSDFVADGTLGGVNVQAFDTFSLTIDSEPGYAITKVTYFEEGTRNVLAGGIAIYTGSATANGQSNALGFNLFQGASNGTWDTDAVFMYDVADNVTSVNFSVTNSLIAFGDSQIGKTGASITVETSLVPLPPAAWMMGSALLGLLAVRRKSLK